MTRSHLPFAIISLCLCAASACAQTSPSGGNLKLQLQENTTTSLLHAVQRQFPKFHITPMEYRSRRVNKLLPGCTVFITVGAPTGSSGPYIFDKQGHIWDLEGGVWTMDKSGQTSRNDAVSHFLASRALKIAGEEDAIEAARLIEELCGTSTQLVSIRNNTEHFTIYNPDFFYKPADHERSWKYTAVPKDNTWTVTSTYIGPPASIMMPPTWVFTVDGAGEILSVHRK